MSEDNGQEWLAGLVVKVIAKVRLAFWHAYCTSTFTMDYYSFQTLRGSSGQKFLRLALGREEMGQGSRSSAPR